MANFRAKCSVSVFALFEDANGLAVFKSAGSVRYARSTSGYAEFATFGDTCYMTNPKLELLLSMLSSLITSMPSTPSILNFGNGKTNLSHGVQYRRHAVVVIAVISAVITPPDLFTCCMVIVPMYGLYELSILIVAITNK